MSRTPASRHWAVLAGVLLALLLPGTAAAHGEEGLADTDYRVTITKQPALSGVQLRVVEAGARIELRYTGDRSVEILGYSQEPYAELRPDGAFVNDNSPATYRNESTDTRTEVPDGASPALAPQWRKVSDEPAIRWHDHRAGWMNERPPPAVLADPGTDREVLQWTVPLRSGTEVYPVSGTVEWVAPPSTSAWWAAALLLSAGALALLLKVDDLRPAAAGVGLLGAAALVDALGRSVTSADLETGWFGVLVADQSWQALAGAAGLAAAGYALRRGAAADLAAGIAAAALALLSGVSHVSCLGSAITPTPWPGDVSRVFTVAALGIGSGVALGILVRMRRPAPAAQPGGR